MNNWGWIEHLRGHKNLKVILGDVSDFKSLDDA